MNNFSDYIVFVDESGDHGIENIDSDYPVFVLTCSVFEKQYYCDVVLPMFSKFKMKYWGNDTVILHEADIRRQKKSDYNILKNPEIRQQFMEDLSLLMNELEFFHISTIIDKNNIGKSYSGKNPYDMSLLFCLENIYSALMRPNGEMWGKLGQKLDVIIEKRGLREDNELELEFRRIKAGTPSTFKLFKDLYNIDFNMVMQDKKANIIGLQITDLIARPIGLSYLRKGQVNKSYDIIKDKKIKNMKSKIKVFP